MRSAASLRDRATSYFVAPRPSAPVAVAPHPATSIPTRLSPRVAVLGAAADATPVAGAVANTLRAAHESPAAAVAIWAPDPAAVPGGPRLAIVMQPGTGSGAAVAEPRSAPATPAALRLAARLTARGLPAAGRGRLAWLRLADHPVAAALAARRLDGALDAPLVIALAGPRAEVLEALLREQDLVVVVAREPEGALARLALAGCEAPAIACAPLPPGAARLLALAGLSGARTLAAPLRTALQRVAQPPPAHPIAGHAAPVDAPGADW